MKLTDQSNVSSGKKVTLRKFPYPYRAAVSIENDCEFMEWETYLELYRFLCSKDGLGLEISNSLFFFVTNALCHSSFGYFDGRSGTPSVNSSAIREMVKAGYIDAIHAYGDFDDGSFKRSMAERVYEECAHHGLTFKIWSNHGSDKNYQNIGHRNLAQYQEGDDPDSPFYHLDITRRLGIRYFCVDDSYANEPCGSIPLLYTEQARDGSSLRLFRRYRGLSGKPAPNASSLPEQILINDIDMLIAKEQACVYYQHLGCWRKTEDGRFESNRPPFFSDNGIHTLEYLSKVYHEAKCLVTATSRLLRYLEVVSLVKFESVGDEILMSSSSDGITPEDLEGVTFYVEDPLKIKLTWLENSGNKILLPSKVFTEPYGGKACIGVPWTRLGEFIW